MKTKRRNGWLLSLLLLIAVCGKTAAQDCGNATIRYQPGEALTYDVYYNWGILWVKAGIVTFKVNESTSQGKDAFHLYAYGRSLKRYDWIFKVRDTFESWVDAETQAPLAFNRDTREGGTVVKNKYEYDYDRRVIYTQKALDKQKTKFKHDTLAIKNCIKDVMTMVYHARNIDYKNYKKDDKIPMSLVIDSESFDNLYIRYLGKEKFKLRNGERYKVDKFSPKLVEGTIFSGGEDMKVWVTDDKNRMPLMVQAKILVGSVKAILRDYQGLKYENSALLK